MKEESGKDLFEEIVQGLQEGYDMESSVKDWINDSVIELFDSELAKNPNIVDPEVRKTVYQRILEECPTFFTDPRNTAYLKLWHLYERNCKKNGENQDFYYITDCLAPSDKEYNPVTNRFDQIKNEEINVGQLKEFYQDEVEEFALEEYYDALDYGENIPHKNKNQKNAVKILSESLDETYIFECFLRQRETEYYKKARGFSLATLYCSINGNSFTIEERTVIAGELSQTQNILLDQMTGRKSK